MARSEMTFGATVVPTAQHNDHTEAAISALPAMTPAITQESVAGSYADTHRPIPPYSPFYQHPPASHEQVASTKTAGKFLDISTVEKGLGSHEDLTPMSNPSDNPFCSTLSVNANKECTMWPSRQTLVTTQMVEKKKKRSAHFGMCAGPRNWWEQLHKKQKLMVRIAVALVIVGAMIGLGVGISTAVHGSYYSGSGSSTST